MNQLTLTEEQESAVQQVLVSGVRSGGAVDGSEMGSGKTVMTVELGVRMWAERVLIIAPNSTFDNWEATLMAQSGQVLLPCAKQKIGSHKATVCKANLESVLGGAKGWFFVGREMFAAVDWHSVVQADGSKKHKQKRVWQKHVFDFAVYDESQRISRKGNNGTKSWLALRATLKKVQSADWFGNDLSNMHTVARSVWPSADHVEPNFVAWRDKFLTTNFDPFTWDKKRVVGEKQPGEFANTLPCYVRLLSPVGVLPVAEQRWVDLSPKQQKLYDELDKQSIVWVENNPLVTELPMHIRIRSRQLTLGMFSVDEEGHVDFPDEGVSAKLDELLSLLADYPDQKFVVGTDSQKFARVAALRLNAKGIKTAEWSGQVSQTGRETVKRRFVEGDLRVVVGVISSFAEGNDGFQGVCHSVVFLSKDDSELLNRQFVGRLHRKGQQHTVNVWDILGRNTFDSGQVSTLMQRALTNNAAKKVTKHDEGIER